MHQALQLRGYIKTNMSNEHFSYLTYITYLNTVHMVLRERFHPDAFEIVITD